MAIYLDIAAQLREELSQHYQAGEFLPPEKQLAERFGVNRHTLRRAVDELVHDGLIRRYQGLGNQIIHPPIAYSLHDRSCFSYNLMQAGLKLKTQVLSCDQVYLPKEISERLELPPHSPAILLKTCRYIDRDPVTLINHHLFGVDLDTLLKFKDGSLHHFLSQHYGFKARRGTTSLRARMPNSQECHQLKMGRGIPVMEVHTRNYLQQPLSAADRLMEFSIAVSRSDLFEYSLEP